MREVVLHADGSRWLYCFGEDDNPASPTVGMGIVRWKRPLAEREVAEWQNFQEQFSRAHCDTTPSTGDVSREHDAWRARLPREEVR